MAAETIVRHCSPVLAGIKTGNMFNCAFSSRKQMNESMRRWNRKLGSKGMRMIPLRFRKGRALVYVYRPEKLSEDLSDEDAGRILRSCGYSGSDPGYCVSKLVSKIGGNGEFPHEVGLFLGYPPEDVSGYMENRTEGFKCVGCWKVYGDAEKAKCEFARYKKCTDIFCRRVREGVSVENLAVAI